MKSFNIKLITLIFLLTSVNAFAVLQTIHLGTFGSTKAWEAKQYGEGDSKICFIISEPSQTSPEGLNRDDPALMISNFLSDKVTHEASVDAGFIFKPKSLVEVIIKNNKYKFFAIEGRAWLANGEDGKQLIKDMKNGSRVKVKSISSRGTKITDTYSLIGFTKALKAIDKACS
jgi:hypothetical protein|tara:strand:+ start:3781 stop:4299 length:519 start_codon:yes stop_codon:yes gene_type:complete